MNVQALHAALAFHSEPRFEPVFYVHTYENGRREGISINEACSAALLRFEQLEGELRAIYVDPDAKALREFKVR